MPTVIVSSVIANKYLNGGNAWAVLNWVLGFRELGCRVYLLEQIYRDACVDETGAIVPFEDSVNLTYFQKITEEFDLTGHAALIYENGEQVYGLTTSAMLDLAVEADLLVNISGHLTYAPVMRRLRRKAYLDLDPGFTQFWHSLDDTSARLAGHDYFFTVGENIGMPECIIPTGEIHWQPTRQPVVLKYWPVSHSEAPGRFTTVASWRGAYGPVQHGGKHYGLKVHEFRKFIELPLRAEQEFEIALDIHRADRRDFDLLRENGWRLIDPKLIVPDPVTFRRYVQTSGAEFSVAQNMYVETGSGWFSDRTVRYLACGKPVLVQDTGFSRNYPVGEGLLAFRTMEEAVDGARRITADYEQHCREARRLAETYFDSGKVLGQLLADVGM